MKKIFFLPVFFLTLTGCINSFSNDKAADAILLFVSRQLFELNAAGASPPGGLALVDNIDVKNCTMVDKNVFICHATISFLTFENEIVESTKSLPFFVRNTNGELVATDIRAHLE